MLPRIAATTAPTTAESVKRHATPIPMDVDDGILANLSAATGESWTRGLGCSGRRGGAAMRRR